MLCCVRVCLSGLRLFWCSPKFVLCSALVAVKRFQPAAELGDGTQLSEGLLVWAEEALVEMGLGTGDLFSTVTDGAGSGVQQRLCLKVSGSAWEWCFPHMLNCALVEVREWRHSCFSVCPLVRMLCTCLYTCTIFCDTWLCGDIS